MHLAPCTMPRENYRITAVGQFFTGLIEGLTLAITPIVALSGLRTAKLLERIKKHMRNDMDMDFMSNFPLLVAVWEQLFKLVLDLLLSRHGAGAGSSRPSARAACPRASAKRRARSAACGSARPSLASATSSPPCLSPSCS